MIEQEAGQRVLRTLNRSESPFASHVPLERDAARLTCGISPRFLDTSRAPAPGRDDWRSTSPVRARGFAPGTPLAFTPGRKEHDDERDEHTLRGPILLAKLDSGRYVLLAAFLIRVEGGEQACSSMT
jgi:hypothetical protein